MKTRLFLALGLLVVLLTSACTSNTTITQPSMPQPAEVEPSAAALDEVQPTLDLTATPPVDVQPAATSRGPDLEATDPSTVSLASGQVQFVEFFRFT